jgi:2-keto-4-pentenoate hydratase/2-oxohepta-3-ene-1,7-dioic acid hydratase in catechol pathway
MQIARYNDDRLGVVRGANVHDVTALQAEIRSRSPYTYMGDPVVAFLKSPENRRTMAETAAKAASVAVASVQLRAPVARPTKLVCAPTNYQKHIEEMAAARVARGSKHTARIGDDGLFLKANSALVGPGDGLAIRFPDRRNDHEAELVVVIGKTGSDIPLASALDYVAGYSLGLDMTVRGGEDRSFRKSPDGYAVLGPWLVTADDISDPDNVPLELTVNGETRQKSDTSQLIYGVRRLIEFASSFYTLYPGDLIYTGTPDGVGPVMAGDVIRVTSATSLGALEIAVRARTAARPESR